jgi:hypothetical protein
VKPMSAWGVAVFSDDLAADVRDSFRELIGEGLSSTEATEKLLAQFASPALDPEEAPVFWIALASVQWKLGRLEERTQREALRLIESGQDLRRWQGSKNEAKRAAVLEKVRQQLLSPPPPAKRVPRVIKEANDWQVGEVIGLQLLSGNWALMRVIGHFEDKGGRFAVGEFLDWVGKEIPPAEIVTALDVKNKKGSTPPKISQVMFCAPRKKPDQARVRRLGIVSTPTQSPGGFMVLIWPKFEPLLEKVFGIE